MILIRLFLATFLALTPLISFATDSALNTNTEKLSYIIGTKIARDLKTGNIDPNIDLDTFLLGVEDTLQNNDSRIDPEKGERVFGEYQQRKASQLAALSAKNLKTSEAFLAKNAKQDGIVVTESGLQYRVIREGDGPSPSIEDQVQVHSIGKTVSGTIFTDSYKKGEPFIVTLDSVPSGLTEVLLLMKEGAKWQVFMPAYLGFRERGTADIGPNEALIFDLELLSIVPSKQNDLTMRPQ